ncbi:unnamed protein product [Closterium sp. NIES-64]|nr:unnamed protein product [Closterium sp. NIES-64]
MWQRVIGSTSEWVPRPVEGQLRLQVGPPAPLFTLSEAQTHSNNPQSSLGGDHSPSDPSFSAQDWQQQGPRRGETGMSVLLSPGEAWGRLVREWRWARVQYLWDVLLERHPIVYIMLLMTMCTTLVFLGGFLFHTFRRHKSLGEDMWDAWSALVSSSSHLKVRWGAVERSRRPQEPFGEALWDAWGNVCSSRQHLRESTQEGRVIGIMLTLGGLFFYSLLTSTMTTQFKVRLLSRALNPTLNPSTTSTPSSMAGDVVAFSSPFFSHLPILKPLFLAVAHTNLLRSAPAHALVSSQLTQSPVSALSLPPSPSPSLSHPHHRPLSPTLTIALSLPPSPSPSLSHLRHRPPALLIALVVTAHLLLPSRYSPHPAPPPWKALILSALELTSTSPFTARPALTPPPPCEQLRMEWLREGAHSQVRRDLAGSTHASYRVVSATSTTDPSPLHLAPSLRFSRPISPPSVPHQVMERDHIVIGGINNRLATLLRQLSKSQHFAVQDGSAVTRWAGEKFLWC